MDVESASKAPFCLLGTVTTRSENERFRVIFDDFGLPGRPGGPRNTAKRTAGGPHVVASRLRAVPVPLPSRSSRNPSEIDDVDAESVSQMPFCLLGTVTARSEN